MSNAPKFGLKHEHRPYRCTVCAHETTIGTNHTDSCLNHCSNCSWKSIGFGPGVRMFGTVHRKFVFAGEQTAPDVDEEEMGCPGCDAKPGDGYTAGCHHPEGCGYFKSAMGALSNRLGTLN